MLALDQNLISVIPKIMHLPNLIRIDLENNCFKKIPENINLPRLEKLNITFNPINIFTKTLFHPNPVIR